MYPKNVAYTNCGNSIEYSGKYDISKNGLLNGMKNAAFLLSELILSEAVIFSQQLNINVMNVSLGAKWTIWEESGNLSI